MAELRRDPPRLMHLQIRAAFDERTNAEHHRRGRRHRRRCVALSPLQAELADPVKQTMKAQAEQQKRFEAEFSKKWERAERDLRKSIKQETLEVKCAPARQGAASRAVQRSRTHQTSEPSTQGGRQPEASAFVGRHEGSQRVDLPNATFFVVCLLLNRVALSCRLGW